jgi:hypothetical protein
LHPEKLKAYRANQRGKRSDRTHENLKCFVCDEKGHIAQTCPVKKAANDSSEAAAAAFVRSGFALMAYTSQGASYEELVSTHDKNKNREPAYSGDSSGSRCVSAYFCSEDSLLSVSTLDGVQSNFPSGGEYSKLTSGEVHNNLVLSSGSSSGEEQFIFTPGGVQHLPSEGLEVFHIELSETFHCLHVNCGISDNDESVPEHKDTQTESADEDTAGVFGLVAGNAIDSDLCWVLDSGASDHMSGRGHLFENVTVLQRPVSVTVATGFSKKIVYSKPSNYGLKNYCVAISGPPLGLNDYNLAPPTRRSQNKNRTASINGSLNTEYTTMWSYCQESRVLASSAAGRGA